MSGVSGKILRLVFFALLGVGYSIPIYSQQPLSPEAVPPNFKADDVFAARIRALTISSTQSAIGHYPAGQRVFQQLIQQLPATTRKYSWELRIANRAGNMFASPDGTIFVDRELAQLLGAHAGLWAAALSHEIEHVVRRDWARRYLFQESLQESVSAEITGDTAAWAGGTWVDAQASGPLFSAFCQRMELEADAAGLMLMARAGFHPDFMPALYHLLQAQPVQLDPKLLDSSHPLWDDRDEKLRSQFGTAGREFEQLWPDHYLSPGGNAPIVVYAGLPFARRAPTGELEVLVPLHCDNLYGSVEVVLGLKAAGSGPVRELRQYTGCTSDRTRVTFTLANSDVPAIRSGVQITISVLDDNGSLLARALAQKAIR